MGNEIMNTEIKEARIYKRMSVASGHELGFCPAQTRILKRST